MQSKFINNIIYAPMQVLKEAFIALGVLLSSYQGIALFFPDTLKKATGLYPLLIFAVISLIYGRCGTWKPTKIEIPLPNTHTTIEVLFADLFTQEGLVAIPVNNFFDSEIGIPVSNKSLHGILIEKHLQGKTFDMAIGKQLDNIPSGQVAGKIEGKKNRYPIGTTITINTDKKYLAFASTKTIPETCKATSDVPTMFESLQGLWQKARIESGGEPVNVPLIGSGLAGVGLPAKNLLDIIILSIITETKRNHIAGKIRIVLYHDHFEKLNLRDIKQYWKSA